MLQRYAVSIKEIVNGKVMASIMAWDTSSLVEIPKKMLNEEFVAELAIHVASGNVAKTFWAHAMLNLSANSLDELFDGAYFVS